MSYKIELRPLAALEVIEGFDWCELQREGLGHEFLHEVGGFFTMFCWKTRSHTHIIREVYGKVL
jgi:hypothetical protein